jgi:hypothetical protein
LLDESDTSSPVSMLAETDIDTGEDVSDPPSKPTAGEGSAV